MNFKKYKFTLRYKNYSFFKTILRFVEYRIRNLFYKFFIFLNYKKKGRSVISLGSYKDSRFINFLFYSLKKKYIFSYNKNKFTLLFLKKIGITNFLRFTIDKKKCEPADKIYKININKNIPGQLNINTDYFSYINHKQKIKNYLIMPYYMYPEIYNSYYNKILKFNSNFSFRIFFSGGIYKKVYSRFKWKIDKVNILNRNEVINLIIKEFKKDIFFINSKNDLKSNNIFKKKIILCLHDKMVSKKKYILNFKQNFQLLSKAAFHLNCSGTVMPLCHHLIEGMKLGCIPITPSYKYIYPNLNSDIALKYTDRQSILDSIYKALNMKKDKIKNKREKVNAFYNKYLSPMSFLKKFDDNIMLKKPKTILACNDHESIKWLNKNNAKKSF